MPILHQFLTGAAAGDAITGQTLLMQKWLQELGFTSHIFAEFIDETMVEFVRPLASYRPSRQEKQVIYHHSLGSNVAPLLLQQKAALVLIYHNVTPPQFFARIDPAWAAMARLGQKQLQQICAKTTLALADSAYNAAEMVAAGYEKTAVLPITLDETRYQLPHNSQLAYHIHHPSILFVGRIAPNKKQEDLLQLLYAYHRIQPNAHLYLVGSRWEVGYDKWLEQRAADMGLANHVTLTDKLSQQDMITYYAHADVYVSMSEHEGFGLPLLESMYFGLPVLAYSTTAVPDTMGQAGIRFHQKDFAQLAELIDYLMTNPPFRQRIIETQHRHVAQFLEPQVRQKFCSYLREAGILTNQAALCSNTAP